MSEKKHRTELSAEGNEKIEAKIQRIENLANAGIFNEVSRTSRFQQIVLETKQLRQILRDVLMIVPENSASGGGEAA